VRTLAGAGILTVLLWRLGTGPFLDGLRRIDAGTLLLAAGIGAVTTVGCAWRWCLVARGLGVRLSPGAALAAYYRSQFLNATLPTGVLGDVHRALRHGRDVGAAADLRGGVFSRRNGPGVALASTVAVAGHLATFLVAARAAGAAAPLTRLVPLGLLVLLAMAVPVNFGGWGPREGAAAWAFGAAGLSAALGVSTAVVYGVLVLSATAPGAGVLVARWIARRRMGSGARAHSLPRAPARLRRQNAFHG
jgi:uncharacterized membrane protein YbhN (UPF0104 family)